ncbi:MAG: tail fiber domain-containing protein [Bacteroidota bacterium]
MPVKDRNALRQDFPRGVLPTQQAYHNLIDSMLNRREDQFFGIWREGKRYCQGDVVIYDKTLYQLALRNAEDQVICADDENEVPEDASCLCSETSPKLDTQNWCELQLAVDDRDWDVILDEDGEEAAYVYQVGAMIGIGTERARTRLEVAGNAGQVLVDPDGVAPTVSLLTNVEGGECRTDVSLAAATDFITDSLGYAFFRKPKPEIVGNKQAAKTNKAPATAPEILLVLSQQDGRPTAGIGTETPQGALHVEDEGYGRFVVNHHGGNEAATVLLLDTAADGNGSYLLGGVNRNVGYLQTDAVEGMRLYVGGKLDGEMGQGLAAVAIDAGKKVGIGTETPRSKVEVTEADMGTIRMDFSNDNVCLSTINERPSDPDKYPATYHAFGVDDVFGILTTDAPNGFVFKAGRPCGEYDHEVNVNQGEMVAYLTREGRMGLRTVDPPAEFDLQVNGHQLSQTAYLETNGKHIEADGTLDGAKALEQLKKLKPIYFKWRANTNAADAGRQIGFNAQNVFESFPELTRNLGTDKTVAYGNLTAVLVAAIKEQQRIIKDLDDRLCALEGQDGD